MLLVPSLLGIFLRLRNGAVPCRPRMLCFRMLPAPCSCTIFETLRDCSGVAPLPSAGPLPLPRGNLGNVAQWLLCLIARSVQITQTYTLSQMS